MAHRRLSAALAVLVTAALAPVIASDVRVVAPTGTPFSSIQAAVDASVNSDVVLVKSGSYQGFNLIGKSVSVVADEGATVSILNAMRVRNCTGTVVLAGLSGVGATSSVEAERNALTAAANTGALRVQNCTLSGNDTGSVCGTRHGALVQDCPNVAITNSVLVGANSGGGLGFTEMMGSTGLEALRSSVALYDAQLRGGTTACSALGYLGADGGEGLQADDSFAFASHVDLRGGNGASVTCGDGGPGGHAVEARGGSTLVQLLDSTRTGGTPGHGNTPYQCPCAPWWLCCDCFSDGGPGQLSVEHNGATVATLNGAHRQLQGPNVARESTTITLSCEGEPGDFVALAIGRNATFQWSPGQNGVQLVGPAGNPSRLRILGVVPASGVLDAALTLAPLPAGVQGDLWHMQTIHLSSGGTRFLGSALSLVVLDGSI